MILVEGMPVGSLFGFAWNLLGKFPSPHPMHASAYTNDYDHHSIRKFPVCWLLVDLFTAYFTCCQGNHDYLFNDST